MAEFKRIAIADIVVTERLRAVEEDHAQAIALSIAEHGLLNPVTVRFTPNVKGGKFTLVAGAHRLRGVEINGETEIDALIVDADKTEAALQEITENLFRNELSVIDRAAFVKAYRELWEEKNGTITRGGDHEAKRKLFALLDGETVTGSFSEHVADRLGVSKRSIEFLNKIAQHLHPDVRDAVRGTSVADNQSALLKLAKLEPAIQRRAAIAFREEGDVKRALQLIGDAPQPPQMNKQDKIRSSLVDLWSRANADTRAFFIQHIHSTEENAA
ncbi:ParB N-terminal domain-containing protein [Brucella anthropi]|uniref:ParB N-terminal domain-containing protein n=1 Tax=Brucella anthropi TaxID=529 RepID=UPI0023600006|nr:ParB N-terminal domain-containing protein [Brucella anthropi]